MDVPLSRVVYRFSGLELDAVAYELTRDGTRIRLARQPMELLLLLVQRAGELVSRDEIARHLWPGDVFVEVDAGIQAAVLKIRQALGDRNREASLVVTVPGKGYRFSAPVQVVAHDERRRHCRESTTSTPVARRHNLPAELTTFVGRRNQIEQLLRLLTTTRLLTLTGSGGVGKTRLAVRLAQSAVANVAAGAWMVDLGTLSRPDLIPETIAGVLGLREDANRSPRENGPRFSGEPGGAAGTRHLRAHGRGLRGPGRGAAARITRPPHHHHEPGGAVGRRRSRLPGPFALHS